MCGQRLWRVLNTGAFLSDLKLQLVDVLCLLGSQPRLGHSLQPVLRPSLKCQQFLEVVIAQEWPQCSMHVDSGIAIFLWTHFQGSCMGLCSVLQLARVTGSHGLGYLAWYYTIEFGFYCLHKFPCNQYQVSDWTLRNKFSNITNETRCDWFI